MSNFFKAIVILIILFCLACVALWIGDCVGKQSATIDPSYSVPAEIFVSPLLSLDPSGSIQRRDRLVASVRVNESHVHWGYKCLAVSLPSGRYSVVVSRKAPQSTSEDLVMQEIDVDISQPISFQNVQIGEEYIVKIWNRNKIFVKGIQIKLLQCS